MATPCGSQKLKVTGSVPAHLVSELTQFYPPGTSLSKIGNDAFVYYTQMLQQQNAMGNGSYILNAYHNLDDALLNLCSARVPFNTLLAFTNSALDILELAYSRETNPNIPIATTISVENKYTGPTRKITTICDTDIYTALVALVGPKPSDTLLLYAALDVHLENLKLTKGRTSIEQILIARNLLQSSLETLAKSGIDADTIRDYIIAYASLFDTQNSSTSKKRRGKAVSDTSHCNTTVTFSYGVDRIEQVFPQITPAPPEQNEPTPASNVANQRKPRKWLFTSK